jgi:hypothetical protein
VRSLARRTKGKEGKEVAKAVKKAQAQKVDRPHFDLA